MISLFSALRSTQAQEISTQEVRLVFKGEERARWVCVVQQRAHEFRNSEGSFEQQISAKQQEDAPIHDGMKTKKNGFWAAGPLLET